MDQILNAALAILFGVGGLFLYYFGSNWLLDTFLGDRIEPDGSVLKSNANSRESIRPWLFIIPGLVLLTVYLLYPAVATLYYTFFDAQSKNFVGLDNYEWAVNSSDFRTSVFNNILWIVVVPFMSTALGLLIAVLADRVRWESIAKSLIFMPMAISFVGASVIWRFVYAFRGEDQPQIGILNSLVIKFGGEPIAWISEVPINNLMLMIILIWIETGFAMVILSSALKSVPEETLEASRIDGANEFQIFFRVMIPQIAGTLAVVTTTILITTLKVFDIVLVMTNGQFDTEVLGNYMFRWMFRGLDDGKASVVALTIMVA
ncbi:MAG TPA: sugar ABC transporter permease, partial [Aggregatilineales bacterium]|nr:sugar ABC transporter permease [Aggregatilineales bacterium]